MKVFANGVLLASNNRWNETTDVAIPADTSVITIECLELGEGPTRSYSVGGSFASGSDELVSDSSLKCGTTGTQQEDWNNAYEIGKQPMLPWKTRPRIASNANWIWNSSVTWDSEKRQRVSCQKNLGNS